MKNFLMVIAGIAAALAAFIGIITVLARYGDGPLSRSLKAMLQGNDYTVMPMDDDEV